MKIGQQDWKLFKECLPIWQNRHLKNVVNQYLEILSDNGTAPAEKFWQLENRVSEDKKHPGVIVEMNRDNVVSTIVSMLREGIITEDDLNGFSDELKEVIRFFLN